MEYHVCLYTSCLGTGSEGPQRLVFPCLVSERCRGSSKSDSTCRLISYPFFGLRNLAQSVAVKLSPSKRYGMNLQVPSEAGLHNSLLPALLLYAFAPRS